MTVQLHAGSLNPYREYGLASLVLPGLGHLLQGLLGRALLWLGGAVVLWRVLLEGVISGFGDPLWLAIAPAVAGYHTASMYAAIRASLSQSGDRELVSTAAQVLPSYLWKQAIGGALAVAGVIVLVLLAGRFADDAWLRLQNGWGGGHRNWGELLSYILLLWAMTATGGWLFWQGYKEQKVEAPRQHERMLVAHAMRNGGVITPAEASLALHVPITEARDYLEQLTQQGLALREEHQGLVCYRLIPDKSVHTL